jgi:hypothetical protein
MSKLKYEGGYIMAKIEIQGRLLIADKIKIKEKAIINEYET